MKMTRLLTICLLFFMVGCGKEASLFDQPMDISRLDRDGIFKMTWERLTEDHVFKKGDKQILKILAPKADGGHLRFKFNSELYDLSMDGTPILSEKPYPCREKNFVIVKCKTDDFTNAIYVQFLKENVSAVQKVDFFIDYHWYITSVLPDRVQVGEFIKDFFSFRGLYGPADFNVKIDLLSSGEVYSSFKFGDYNEVHTTLEQPHIPLLCRFNKDGKYEFVVTAENVMTKRKKSFPFTIEVFNPNIN